MSLGYRVAEPTIAGYQEDIARMRLVYTLPVTLAAMLLTACTTQMSMPSTPGPPQTANDGSMVLVFADEFDSGTAPSVAWWTVETGYGPNNDGWGNNEWQLYTDSSDNVRVENGNLVLTAKCLIPPCGSRDGTITSGKINSKGKFDFRFGRVVARIKPPVGNSVWPAFWSLGSSYPEVPWPQCGELNFMKMHTFNSNDRTTHTTMHWCDESIQAPEACGFPAGWVSDSQHETFPGSLGDDFHTWEVDWNADRVVGSMDGVPYFHRTISPGTMEEFLSEFFLILNVAVGGTLGSGNQPPDSNETFSQEMLVDFVRVYQFVDEAPAAPERAGL